MRAVARVSAWSLRWQAVQKHGDSRRALSGSVRTSGEVAAALSLRSTWRCGSLPSGRCDDRGLCGREDRAV